MQRLSLLALAVCVAGVARAQPADPVDALHQVLRAPARDPAQRGQGLNAAIDSVRSLADLRRAAALPDWRDEDVDPIVATVDRQQRLVLVQRFRQVVREALAPPQPSTTKITVCDMLADLGVTTRGVGTAHSLARDFGPDLAQLLVSSDPAVAWAAARALGKIDADPAVAVPALAILMRVPDAQLRVAAAGGLVDVIKTATDLAFNCHSGSGVGITCAELIELVRTVIPVAAARLGDPAPEVRRRCLEAIGRSAATLNRLVLDPPRAEGALEDEVCRMQIVSEHEQLLPPVITLRDQGEALARELSDRDPEARALARRIIAVIVELRNRWLRRGQIAGLADDPLLDGLQPVIPRLIAGLRDSDSRARQTIIGIFEALGPAAAPAIPALTLALDDSDRFVRWSAARALGKVGAPAAVAVPALARQLGDSDLDLSLAAAAALERFGPTAEVAVPALTAALREGSAELRLAAIRALQTIGPPAALPALADLAAALNNEDARVRLAAAVALGRFGPAAASTSEALRNARSDRNPEVRQAAGAALLNIVQP
jgi:HEAT repeat protein